jgi:hypothetical protein
MKTFYFHSSGRNWLQPKTKERILYKFRVIFSPPEWPAWLWGTSSLLFKRMMSSLPGIKGPGREFSHSLPSSTEFEKEWSCTSASHIHIRGLDSDNCNCRSPFLKLFWHYSSRCIADITNAWSCTSIPQYALMACFFIQHSAFFLTFTYVGRDD